MQNTARKIAAFKTTLPSVSHGLIYPELRPQPRMARLLQKIRKHAAAVNENDDLYYELEHRYGGGFAQGIVDGLKKS